MYVYKLEPYLENLKKGIKKKEREKETCTRQDCVPRFQSYLFVVEWS